jgi:serine/threonine-protein kinase
VDHRTDVYSFGIMLFQVLAGKLPFDGNDLMDLLIKQTTEAPPALSSVASDLPSALDAPLFAMLEKEPDKRPPSVGAAMDAFLLAAQSAGHHVVVGAIVARPAQGPNEPAVQRATPALTPSQLHHMGEAKTVVPVQTFQGAGLDVAPPARKGRPLWLIAIVGVLMGAAVVAFLVVPKRSTGPLPLASGKPETSTTIAVSPTPAVAPSAAPLDAAPAPPAQVLITVRAIPKDAAIYRGDERLGVAPGPITLTQGQDAVKLTLKAEGYTSREFEVTPMRDHEVSEKLTKVAPKPPQPKKAYENPF